MGLFSQHISIIFDILPNQNSHLQMQSSDQNLQYKLARFLGSKGGAEQLPTGKTISLCILHVVQFVILPICRTQIDNYSNAELVYIDGCLVDKSKYDHRPRYHNCHHNQIL